MTRIESDASLRSRVRAIAQQNNLRPQEVLQMYLFEHLLMRLEKSNYSETFVLKGGLLIASMIGVARRTTMDMDTTVIGMPMDEGHVTEAVRAICSEDVDDGMTYDFERLTPIREDDEYANWRVHIRVRYGRMDAPIKVDITTGDAIVPGQVVYAYPRMFDRGSIHVMSYPPETVLAEKFKTVVRRGIANTRARDFYDIVMLWSLHRDGVDAKKLAEAIEATVQKRGSLEAVQNWEHVLGEIQESEAMRDLWLRYAESAPYACGVVFDEVIDVILEIGRTVL